jgi:hypothetical protein
MRLFRIRWGRAWRWCRDREGAANAEVLDSFGLCSARPEWFAPKPSSRYSAWTSERGSALPLRRCRPSISWALTDLDGRVPRSHG